MIAVFDGCALWLWHRLGGQGELCVQADIKLEDVICSFLVPKVL